LNRMVGEASEMAQLDAGEVRLQLASHPDPGRDCRGAAGMQATLGAREVRVEMAANLPPVNVDLPARKGSSHTLARKRTQYSPAGQPIVITAEATNQGVVTSVADRGSGIERWRPRA